MSVSTEERIESPNLVELNKKIISHTTVEPRYISTPERMTTHT